MLLHKRVAVQKGVWLCKSGCFVVGKKGVVIGELPTTSGLKNERSDQV